MFEPENDLENQLVLAARGEGDKDAFVKALLDAQIYVALFGDLSALARNEDGKAVLSKDTQLSLRVMERNGATYIPFFTSPSRIWAITKEDHVAAPSSTRDLFGKYADVYFVLNPGSDYGKEFLPGEVTDLLEGRTSNYLGQIDVPAGTNMRIGEPSVYPTEMVAGLKTLLPEIKDVDAAFLCLKQAGDEEPILLLEIVSKADRTIILNALGPHMRDLVPKGQNVDVRICEAGEDALSYETVEPFYVKTSGLMGRLFSK